MPTYNISFGQEKAAEVLNSTLNYYSTERSTFLIKKCLFLAINIMDRDINEESVFIETTITATVEKVWEAWTEPSIIKKWFGSDPKGEVLSAKLDVRQNGSFEVKFRDSDQTEHICNGIYNEIKKFSKLTFTWHWKSEPGVESFIILLLASEGTSTKMQFEHKNFGSGSKHNYVIGWQSTFLKLERLLCNNR